MAKKKFYRPVLYGLLLLMKGFFSLLPFRAGFEFGGFAGKLAFYVIPKEKKKTLAHLRLAFGAEKTEKELTALGARVFQHYGYMAAELALLDKLIPQLDRVVSISGREHMDAVIAKGKGALGILAHFGNWELMGGTISLLGYPVSAIARKIYYERYNTLLIEQRSKMKVRTIYREDSLRAVPKALRRNEIVGIVADQDVEGVGGVFVDFFGKSANSMVAPVRFALATGAGLVPIFMVREGLHHRMILEPAIELEDTGDWDKDIVTNTQKWVSIQEKYIRQYPHLWVWNHKRWKTTPQS